MEQSDKERFRDLAYRILEKEFLESQDAPVVMTDEERQALEERHRIEQEQLARDKLESISNIREKIMRLLFGKCLIVAEGPGYALVCHLKKISVHSIINPNSMQPYERTTVEPFCIVSLISWDESCGNNDQFISEVKPFQDFGCHEIFVYSERDSVIKSALMEYIDFGD